MARHPTARRVHREAEPEDAFVAKVLETTAWTKKHARSLALALIGVAAVAGGVLYYVNYRNTLRAEAETRLTEIRQTAPANPALAIQDLQALISSFGNTPAGREGRLLLASLYLDQGNASQAVQVLEPMAGDLRSPLGSSAAFILAAAYEALGRGEDAEALYLRLADGAPYSFERREALDHTGRLRMERGDGAGAAQIYDRLIATTPEDSPDRAIFEMRRAEALAMTAAPGAMPAATPAPAEEEAAPEPQPATP